MPSRSRYYRKKYSSRAVRFRRNLRDFENLTVYAGAFLVIILFFIVLQKIFFTGTKKIDIPLENVAAYRIPHKTLPELKILSTKYGIDFAQLVTIYSIEHNFFPAKTDTLVASEIEQNFIINYESIRSQYKNSDVTPYYTMINSLLNEMKYFPIPYSYDKDDSVSYMFGDSWEPKTNRGTDILDRENVRGRIPVVSMTAGTVSELGWKENTGFQVSVKTSQGNLYSYSRMDSFADGLVVGSVIQPGQFLGYMGTVKNTPSRLHISISPYFDLGGKDFYINPYPFLRLIESTKIEFKA